MDIPRKIQLFRCHHPSPADRGEFAMGRRRPCAIVRRSAPGVGCQFAAIDDLNLLAANAGAIRYFHGRYSRLPRTRAGRDLGPADALSVGMFLQTLLLALTARGLDTCVEVSIAGYPEIVRAQLAIPAELSILCGLAVGYPDPDFPANKLHTSAARPSKRTWCSWTVNRRGELGKARSTPSRARWSKMPCTIILGVGEQRSRK